MAEVHATAPGAAALGVLRDAIAAAKAGDPLAAVTVVVPSARAGLSIRRSLAAGSAGPLGAGERLGLVNVGFLAFGRLAELLGSPGLAAAGRTPVTNALRAEALRAELSHRPGVFGAVAHHAGSERALLRAFDELRPCDGATLDRLAGTSERAADLVRLHLGWRERLAARWYDEHDLTETATAAVAAGPKAPSAALADLGPIVVFLPRRATAGQQALLAALGSRAAVIEADVEAGPSATKVVIATDPDEEVRAVVRMIAERLAAGVPLHRIGVLHPDTDGYGALVHEHLAAADFPANGPSGRTLAQCATGRALLELLALPDHGWQRGEVIGWLAAAPVVDAGSRGPVPAARWDAISRAAGVVAGADQWSERLARHEATLVAEQGEADPDEDEWRRQRRADNIEHTRRLRRFVADLVATVEAGAPQPPATWATMSAWAVGLVDRTLGHPGTHRWWPDHEQQAFASVRTTIEGLAGLDALGQPAELTAFRRAVERAFDVPAGPAGRFGDGVLVSPIRLGAGLDLDVVFVVGLAEGTFPGRSGDDALIPDRERDVAAGELAARRSRLDDDRRDLVVALAAGRRERIMTFPRADLRRGRDRLPSRWLLEAALGLAGDGFADTGVFGDELDRLASTDANAAIVTVPSHEHGLRGATDPGSLHDRDLRELIGWTRRGGDPAGHPIARSLPSLGRGFACERDRRSHVFTEFDGKVPAGTVGAPGSDAPVSPTSLETYATCPRKHLLSRVLRVAAVERPEEIVRLSALDKGSLVHSVLERYVAGRIDGQPPSLDDLLAIGDEVARDYEEVGLTGKRLLWRYDREVIRRDLVRFFGEDDGEPLAVELPFGDTPETAVTIDTGERQIAFKGIADRVDRRVDGVLRVTDYKTGSSESFKGLSDGDPVDRGRKLQLPLYALAAQGRFGGPGPPEARYWFVTDKGGFRPVGYPVDDDVLTRFGEVVGITVDGILRGSFPARPGEPDSRGGWENCRWCDYNDLCPRDRARQWERKKTAPDVAAYTAMAEGDAS